MPKSEPPLTNRLVLVTGPSGAGRSTAIHALEDLGFEAIDNLPLTMIPRLLATPLERPLALGVDARNRDFSAEAMLELLAWLEAEPGCESSLLYVDASDDVLIRRFSETRRRHPLSPEDTPRTGIGKEFAILAAIRDQAEFLIDTSELSPHDLRAEITQWFADRKATTLALTIESFSYKRGVPRGADLVFDCRFLRNPHWETELRPLSGQDAAVDAHVAADPNFDEFFVRIVELTSFLIPAYRDEGKAHLTVCLGCTGGRHRSVAVTERLGKSLATEGWQVSIRHRELERSGVK